MTVRGSRRPWTSLNHFTAAVALSLFLTIAGLPFAVGEAIAAGGQASWSERSPTTSPSAREGASMAFDDATGQMLLFGGENGSNLADTWVWDGDNWSQLSPTTSPSVRSLASMAYDPVTEQMILFGGYNGGGSGLSDTWAWDGTNWSLLSPTTSPPSRFGASMAFDSASDQLLLFGGFDGSYFGDTWAWDGTTWSEVSSSGPTARYAPSMAYDPVSGQLLLGGLNSGNYFADAWEWDGTAWNSVSIGGPTARDFANLAYDPATEQLLLFGGYDGNYFDNTWAWDGNSWSEVSTSGPSARYGASMAYDPITEQMILFGGYDGSSNLGDTWVYGLPDVTAPTTAASATNADTSTYTFGTWTNQSVTVTLSAVDNVGGDGVAETDYTVDGGGTQTYSSAFTISAEGDHTITYWSVDNASNEETPHQTAHVMIDLTNPTVTYTGNQGSYTVDQTVAITCASSDALSGVASDTCQDISGPAYSFALGVNSYSATATDNAGNVGTGTVSFTVGVTAASLCNLTGQFVGNQRATNQVCGPLNLLRLAEATHSSRLKTSLVNTYILLVTTQHGLSAQEKATLIQLARAL